MNAQLTKTPARPQKKVGKRRKNRRKLFGRTAENADQSVPAQVRSKENHSTQEKCLREVTQLQFQFLKRCEVIYIVIICILVCGDLFRGGAPSLDRGAPFSAEANAFFLLALLVLQINVRVFLLHNTS